MNKLETIESKLDLLVSRNKHNNELERKEIMFKGVNIRQISADNPYHYGMHLMDALFTKEEMADSLMFESKKKKSKTGS